MTGFKDTCVLDNTKQPPAEDPPLAANDATFERLVLQSPVPVLVDFWAVWCAPCRRMAPVVEELAPEYEGRARVVKVSTDEATEWPSRLGIMGIPTFIVFKEGREVDRIIGPVAKPALQYALDRALGTAR